jgi:Xaa-Pro aminopeptidase
MLPTMPHLPTVAEATAARRAALLQQLAGVPALLATGSAPARNYPQNPYGFRASSHVLHLVGPAPAGSYLWLDGQHSALFVDAPDPLDALWHGELEPLDALAERLGIAVRPLPELTAALAGRDVGSVRPPRADDAIALATRLGRQPVEIGTSEADAALADALVQSRLRHDTRALFELRRAAEATVAAHRVGMAATRPGRAEYHVAAAMEHALAQRAMGTSYPSIVTTRGDILHDHAHHRTLAAGQLLLADVGAETGAGYAGDVTRTWPVSGRFSPSQRAIYDVVLGAQSAAVAAVRPGARYRDVHLCAARALTEGLVSLGILVGDPDELVADGVHALFFPHGIGHLLGLDVHDMEDLGDRAGYAPSRTRSSQFGLGYLRLDRDLEPGMVVTIEPGFYRVPMLLADPGRFGIDARPLRRARLAEYEDVAGIRIEDDVLVTEAGAELLTVALPRDATSVELLVGQRAD